MADTGPCFGLDEDQLTLQKWVHDFAEDVDPSRGRGVGRARGVPLAHRRGGRQDRPLRLRLHRRGACSATTPGSPCPSPSRSCSGATPASACPSSARASRPPGIAGNGTPEQVMEWVPQCYGTADKVQLGAFCVSEPDAGSDVSSLRTKAVYDEAKDEWVLNGTKAWITNGGIADVHVVVASVDPELKGRGQASFIVPPGTPGLSQGQKYKKHGIKASAHRRGRARRRAACPVRACSAARRSSTRSSPVPVSAEEPSARPRQAAAMATFEATRPVVGAQAIGIARAAYEYALEYAQERKAFGKAIIENQAIAFMLADMKHRDRRGPAARVARRVAGSQRRALRDAEGSMSKLKAGRTAVWVTERAIQILGGYGYTREYPVERWHRDSKIYDIFEGTEQIQQLVIARAIAGMRLE
ncbi:MAG: acyl-CoA dehydrogenase family protein [Acidimicrobiia bacterium]|nr:acyl-CoA dehydrogenase family protein [Acidimicrobiia bacterium]